MNSDIVNKFIENAYQLEMKMSDLYSLFAEKIDQDADLWHKMSREEKGHAKLIESFARYFSKGSRTTKINQAFLSRLENILQHIRNYIMQNSSVKISRKEAYKKALEFESTAIEIHFHDVFRSLQSEAKNDLFDRLLQQDKKHLVDLNHHIKQHFPDGL